MKFLLTFICLLISNLIFAQNQNPEKPNSASNATASSNVNKSNKDKKVYYVDKRTKSGKNNSSQNRGNSVKKKPQITKAENQNKSSSK